MLWEPKRVWQILLTLNVLKSCESVPFQVPDRIMKDAESKIDLYTISPAVKSSASHRRAQLFFDCCPRNQWSSLMHWDLILLEAHSSLAGPKSCTQQAVKMLEAATVTPFLIPDPCQGTILHILFYHEGKKSLYFFSCSCHWGKKAFFEGKFWGCSISILFYPGIKKSFSKTNNQNAEQIRITYLQGFSVIWGRWLQQVYSRARFQADHIILWSILLTITI